MRLLCRQNGALRLVCAVVAFVAFANRIASAQEGFVQPAGTWTTPAPTAYAPTWQDFNELAARPDASEARLQAMNAYTTAAVVDTNSAYQPNTPSLAAETQTPERTADILRRLGTLESQYSADKAKLPSVRVTGFAQLDYGAFSQ